MASELKGCNLRSDATLLPLGIFTCPEERQALVHGVHVLNDSGDDATFSVGVVRGRDERSRAASDYLLRDEPIAAGELRRVALGLGMQPGDTLFAEASVAGINFIPSVQEVL